MNEKEVELKPEKPKKVGKSKIRKISCFTAVFTVIILLCTGSLGALWAGGWLKDFTCDLVLEDSMIWEKVNCGTEDKQVETVSTPNQ